MCTKHTNKTKKTPKCPNPKCSLCFGIVTNYKIPKATRHLWKEQPGNALYLNEKDWEIRKSISSKSSIYQVVSSNMPGKGLNRGDVVEIHLVMSSEMRNGGSFSVWKNGKSILDKKIALHGKGFKYYPVLQLCGCEGLNHFELVPSNDLKVL